MSANDLFHIRCRAKNGRETAVGNRASQVIDEVGIRIDYDQRSVAPQLFEHRSAKCAYARPVFDEQPAIVPVDPFKHPFDREPRRRNDRAYHGRMFQESFEEDSPRSEQLLDLAFDALGPRLSGELVASHPEGGPRVVDDRISVLAGLQIRPPNASKAVRCGLEYFVHLFFWPAEPRTLFGLNEGPLNEDRFGRHGGKN